MYPANVYETYSFPIVETKPFKLLYNYRPAPTVTNIEAKLMSVL